MKKIQFSYNGFWVTQFWMKMPIEWFIISPFIVEVMVNFLLNCSWQMSSMFTQMPLTRTLSWRLIWLYWSSNSCCDALFFWCWSKLHLLWQHWLYFPYSSFAHRLWPWNILVSYDFRNGLALKHTILLHSWNCMVDLSSFSFTCESIYFLAVWH